MHSSHKHGYRPRVRFLAGGSFCLACGKEYHERARLVAHLYYSSTCADTLEQTFPVLSDEAVAGLDQADREQAACLKEQGRALKKARLPACKVPLVALPPVGSREAQAIRNACSSSPRGSKPWTSVAGYRVSAGLASPPVARPCLSPGKRKAQS